MILEDLEKNISIMKETGKLIFISHESIPFSLKELFEHEASRLFENMLNLIAIAQDKKDPLI
jgi:hypothetical protein